MRRRSTIRKLPGKAPTWRDDSKSSDDGVGLVLYRPPAKLSTAKSDIALPPVQPPSSSRNDQIETPKSFDNPTFAGGDPPHRSTSIDTVPDTFDNPTILAQSDPIEIIGQILDSGQPVPNHQATVINESETLLSSRLQWIQQPSSRFSYYGPRNPLYCTQISTSWLPVPPSMNNFISNYRFSPPLATQWELCHHTLTLMAI